LMNWSPNQNNRGENRLSQPLLVVVLPIVAVENVPTTYRKRKGRLATYLLRFYRTTVALDRIPSPFASSLASEPIVVPTVLRAPASPLTASSNSVQPR